MPETKTFQITLFTYQELSKKMQMKVQEWYWKWVSDNWSDMDSKLITECIAQDLEIKGYPTEKICWSLSNQQGDGVAFYGKLTYENFEVLVRRLMADRCQVASSLSGDDAEFPNNFLEYLENISFEIRKTCIHYDHWNSMRINWECPYTSNEEDIQFKPVFDEFVERLKTDVVETSKGLDRMGYQCIEYHYSEEALIETAQQYGWVFDAEGNLVDIPD